MSTTVAPPDLMPDSTRPETLAGLRADLDALDDAMHDLLVRRAEVVERIATAKQAGRSALRPGREAVILRRLLARHAGRLPPRTLVRIWRELFAGTTAMQGNFTIAVCETEAGAPFVQTAREHFGALTPLLVDRGPEQAIAALRAGRAAAAVLPMPVEGAAWWTTLLERDATRIHVVARLPFWAARPEGAPQVQALVAAAIAPDPSGEDRSLLGLDCPADLGHERLAAMLAAAGWSPGPILFHRAAEACRALIDVAGFVDDADDRLRALALPRPAVVLGAYAMPVGGGWR